MLINDHTNELDCVHELASNTDNYCFTSAWVGSSTTGSLGCEIKIFPQTRIELALGEAVSQMN